MRVIRKHLLRGRAWPLGKQHTLPDLQDQLTLHRGKVLEDRARAILRLH